MGPAPNNQPNVMDLYLELMHIDEISQGGSAYHLLKVLTNTEDFNLQHTGKAIPAILVK